MKSVGLNHRSIASPDRQVPAIGASVAHTLGALTLVAYICQSAFFGPIRYLLVTMQLEFLWYVPDLLGFACLSVALVRSLVVNRSDRLLLFLAVIVAFSLEGYLVSGSVASVLSTLKALVPLFCGLLLDREQLARPIMKNIFLTLLLAACAGVIYALFEEMPWSKLQFEGIGIVQEFRPPQWISGDQIRSYGFAGDEHGAASSIVTLFMLFSINVRKRLFYAVGALSCAALYLTTSRTLLLSFIAYVALYSFAKLREKANNQPILKWALRLSFLAPLLPIVIIGISLSFTAENVPDPLLSLWIRGTYTWFAPFTYMDDLAPFAIIHGFGLGGVSFGLLQSDLARYYTPVDNFILFNYLSFGVFYFIFYFYQCRRMDIEQNPYKILIYIVTAIDGLTLRGWSDSPFMLLFGYSTSGMFSRSDLETAEEQRPRLHPLKTQRSRRTVFAESPLRKVR